MSPHTYMNTPRTVPRLVLLSEDHLADFLGLIRPKMTPPTYVPVVEHALSNSLNSESCLSPLLLDNIRSVYAVGLLVSNDAVVSNVDAIL